MDDDNKYLSYAAYLRLKKRVARRGQQECWNRVAENPEQRDFLFKLATGYGKTDTLIGSYGVARGMGMVDRLLVIVATDTQRAQMETDLLEESREGYLGVVFTGVFAITEKLAAAFRYNKEGKEAFIITYAQLLSNSGFFDELLSYGRWMIVRDEVHHCAEDKAWGVRASDLCAHKNVRKVVNLSATPIRTDGRPLTGIRYSEPDSKGVISALPDVDVDIRAGIKEEALRNVRGEISNYELDVVMDGKPLKLSTETLREQNVTDMQAFLTKRQIRFSTSYINRMLSEAIAEIERRNSRHPFEHQGLIWACSQDHARVIVGQLNHLYDGAQVADWIGIDRPKKENDAVMHSYLGFKYNRLGGREPIPAADRLLFLVQVQKAGEGFNNVRSSVLLMMNLVDAEGPSLQSLGRGLRRNYNIPLVEDTAVVFASSDTNMARLVKALETDPTLRIKAEREEGTDNLGSGNGTDTTRKLEQVEVGAVEHERTDRVFPIGIQQHNPEALHARSILEASGIQVPAAFTDDQLYSVFKLFRADVPGAAKEPESPPQNVTIDVRSELRDAKRQVESMVRRICALTLQIEDGGSKERAGTIKRAVHSRWIKTQRLSHNEMTAEQLKKKLAWLSTVESDLRKEKVIPEWLKSDPAS